MKAYRPVVAAMVLGALALGAGRVEAQQVHEVRLVAEGGEFRFAPASVTGRAGDVLLFRVAGGAHHSVVFEGRNMPPNARQALNAALPRRASNLSSPLLKAGEEYRVIVPALPPGSYQFFCLPHRAYDMRGELTVK